MNKAKIEWFEKERVILGISNPGLTFQIYKAKGGFELVWHVERVWCNTVEDAKQFAMSETQRRIDNGIGCVN